MSWAGGCVVFVRIGFGLGSGGRPGSGIEARYVVAQDVKVYIPDKNAPVKDRVEHTGSLEEFLWKGCKSDVFPFKTGADTTQLCDLFRCQVGLHGSIERCDQGWNAGDDAGTGEFVLQGAHDGVLVVCTLKDAIIADARQGECLFAVQNL